MNNKTIWITRDLDGYNKDDIYLWIEKPVWRDNREYWFDDDCRRSWICKELGTYDSSKVIGFLKMFNIPNVQRGEIFKVNIENIEIAFSHINTNKSEERSLSPMEMFEKMKPFYVMCYKLGISDPDIIKQMKNYINQIGDNIQCSNVRDQRRMEEARHIIRQLRGENCGG